MKNVEEFLAMKEKRAAMPSAWGNFGQHVSHAAAGSLAAATAGAAVAGVGLAANKILDAATKSRDFKAMLAANQDLQEHYDADPKRFNMMFSTLRTMNPGFSKDPLVAGAFMRRMHESPAGIGGIAGEALQRRGDFEAPLMEAFLASGREGAKAGLGESMKYRTPEETFAQKKPELDYQQKFQQEQQGREQQAQRQKTLTDYRLKERSEARKRRFETAKNSRTKVTKEIDPFLNMVTGIKRETYE